MSAAIEWSFGERAAPPILPDLTMEGFAAKTYGCVIPSGAAAHWRFVAFLQFHGLATVDVVSTGNGSAGVVMVTAKGRRAVRQSKGDAP